MKTPVYQFYVVPPIAVDDVFSDILALELPGDVPDRIAVAGLEVSSERWSDIQRATRKGRVFDRAGLTALLEGAGVIYGWFFFGSPLPLGQTVEPVDVPMQLGQSAFVVDILEGNFLSVRTVHQGIALAIKEVVVGAIDIDPCELQDVRMSY